MNHALWGNEYWKIQQQEICEKCKEKRKSFGFSEFEDSPIFPGFFNKLDRRIDIFFVLESLGKRNGKKWPKTPEDAIEDLRYYYLEKNPLEKFHQSCIREVLTPFSQFSYVVSDVVKCFVTKGKEKDKRNNFKTAVNFCSNFLKEQIFNYQPKIIVPIGRTACQTILKFTDKAYHKKIRRLKHSKLVKVRLTGKTSPSFILYCRFPSGRTADYWVKDGGHTPVIKQLNFLIKNEIPKLR
jgi:hypothetical protein